MRTCKSLIIGLFISSSSITVFAQSNYLANRTSFNSIGIVTGIKILPSESPNIIGEKKISPICGEIYYSRFFGNSFGGQLSYDGCYSSIGNTQTSQRFTKITQFTNDIMINLFLGIPFRQRLAAGSFPMKSLEFGFLVGSGAAIMQYANTDALAVARKEWIVGVVANYGVYLDLGGDDWGIIFSVKNKFYFYPEFKSELAGIYDSKTFNSSQTSWQIDLGTRFSF